MRRYEQAMIPLVLWLAALATGGCHSRSIVRFDSHPTRRVVLVETVERSNYALAAAAKRTFWACVEADDSLICERRCGSDTKFQCPTGYYFSNGVAPNLR
jgi:hypothetical protein